jgi:hypothetical protein
LPASMPGPATAGADQELDEYDDPSDAGGSDSGDDDPGLAVMSDRNARVCTEPGCTTVLSRYNATAWCGLHHRRDWRATREVRRRSA